jgi:hypothetical protein
MRALRTACVALAAAACAPARPATDTARPTESINAPPPIPAVAVIDSLALARQFTQWFYNNQMDSLWAHHDEESRKSLGSAAYLERSLVQLTTNAGTETEVMEEKFVKRNGRTQYWRTARFTQMSEPILLRWVIGPRGELMGLGMGPLSQAPPIDP